MPSQADLKRARLAEPSGPRVIDVAFPPAIWMVVRPFCTETSPKRSVRWTAPCGSGCELRERGGELLPLDRARQAEWFAE